MFENLKNKNILLGITGSIASYKSAELVRLFRKAEAKAKRPFCVGFAAETEDLVNNAKAKLIAKNADMI